jgi:cytochrome c553
MQATDCGAVIAAAFFAANAAHADDSLARDWAAGCLSCHQPGARGIPLLHAQPREALISRLRAFRDGTLPGTVMPQLARGYTDVQIEAIAGWFAGASPGPR